MNDLNEKYLVVFAVRIITLIVLLCLFFVLLANVDDKEYMPKSDYFSSFTYMISGEDETTKILVDYDYFRRSKKGHEALDVVKETDKVIDIQNFGIWLTPNQCLLIPLFVMTLMFAGGFWALAGVGHIYDLFRMVAFGLFMELLTPSLILITLPFCIIPLGFGIVIAALFALVTLPFELPYLLIRGIIQIARH